MIVEGASRKSVHGVDSFLTGKQAWGSLLWCRREGVPRFSVVGWIAMWECSVEVLRVSLEMLVHFLSVEKSAWHRESLSLMKTLK